MSKWTPNVVRRLLELYEYHTYEEIADILNDEFDLGKTANAIRKAYERYKYPIVKMSGETDKPKILFFDIETFPMEVYVWSTRQEGVSLDMVKEDWSVLSWAAKWAGEDEPVMYQDVRNQKVLRDDKKLIQKLHKLLDEADIVVGHNSDKFDVKKMNARFAAHGMKPPSSYKRLDTLKMARKHFAFSSNKLSYLTNMFCEKYKKLNHSKFPGFKMWKECLNRNEEAYKEMEEYNKYDVLSLEELFFKLIPWEPATLFNQFSDDDEITCTCGSTEFVEDGLYRTNACTYQKYKCKQCGSEYRDTTNLKKTNVRSTVR